MNTRISEIRKKAGLTQEEFASKIGLSRNFIWMIEKGDRVPSDRTITDICREFRVSEAWLRYGNGPMYVTMNEDDMLSKVLTEIDMSDDVLLKAAIMAYWGLNDAERATIKKMVNSMIEKMNKKKNPGD